MSNGYIIDKVFFIHKGGDHIPYYNGMVVRGPKGGRYYLDEYNTEIAIGKADDWNLLCESTSSIMYNVGKTLGNIEFVRNEEPIEEFISKNKIVKLIRLEGREKATRIKNNLDIFKR